MTTPLGKLLRERRKGDPRSLTKLGAAADVETGTIKHWESGYVKEPPLRGVLRLARELGIPLEELEAAALASQAGGVRDAEVAAGRARAEALGGEPRRGERREAPGDT